MPEGSETDPSDRRRREKTWPLDDHPLEFAWPHGLISDDPAYEYTISVVCFHSTNPRSVFVDRARAGRRVRWSRATWWKGFVWA